MKSAKDWQQIVNDACYTKEPVGDWFADVVAAIQLDAMKEGMRRAANEMMKESDRTSLQNHSAKGKLRDTSIDILTAAEQLTEKDL